MSQSKRNVTINFPPDFISACHSRTFFLSVIFRLWLNCFVVCLKDDVVTLSTQYTKFLHVQLIVPKCALKFSAEMKIFTRKFVLDSVMLSTYYFINYYSSNLLTFVQNTFKKIIEQVVLKCYSWFEHGFKNRNSLKEWKIDIQVCVRYGLPLLENVCNAEKQAKLKTQNFLYGNTFIEIQYITKTFIVNALECGDF